MYVCGFIYLSRRKSSGYLISNPYATAWDQALQQETFFVSEFFCNKKWASEPSLFLINLSSDRVHKYIFEFVA